MRLIKFPLLIVFLSTASFCFAQKQNVYFLKNNGRYVDLRDSADYIRVVREPDSGSNLYNVFEFYINGKNKFIGKSSKIEVLANEGSFISYFHNGAKHFIGQYKNGHLTGSVIEYFPNGKLYNAKEYLGGKSPDKDHISNEDNYLIKNCSDSTGKVLLTDGNGYYVGYHDDFKYIEEEGPVKNGMRDSLWKGQDVGVHIKFEEHYNNGVLIAGIATDSMGNKHVYQQRNVSPQYVGGESALYKYLGNNIEYPDYARSHNIEGTVVLKFVVKKDGTVKDIEIYKSVNKELDQEALRVVKKSKGWQPGAFFGEPANVYFTLPVTFALQ